jgi:ribonuclease E
MPEEQKPTIKKSHWRELADLLGLEPEPETEVETEEAAPVPDEEEMAAIPTASVEARLPAEVIEEVTVDEYVVDEPEAPTSESDFEERGEAYSIADEDDVRIEDLDELSPEVGTVAEEEKPLPGEARRRRGRRSSRRRGRQRKEIPADAAAESGSGEESAHDEMSVPVEPGSAESLREGQADIVIQELPEGEETTAEEGPGPAKEVDKDGKPRRRRGRRRKRKGHEASEAGEKPRARRDSRVRSAVEEGERNEPALDEDEELREEPLVAENLTDYDIMDDAEAEDFSDWTVPSWNDLIASLYRPDR